MHGLIDGFASGYSVAQMHEGMEREESGTCEGGRTCPCVTGKPHQRRARGQKGGPDVADEMGVERPSVRHAGRLHTTPRALLA